MILRILLFTAIINVFILTNLVSAERRLVLVQTLFRHGDRTPLYATKNDPYQEWTWPYRFGELTTEGMAQHFRQGLKLKQRYVNDLRFLTDLYNSSEVVVMSDDEDRTMASAATNFAGFYSDSATTYPSGIPEWPRHWTPIAIRYYDDERVLDPGSDCPRVFEIQEQLSLSDEFNKFLDDRQELFQTVTDNSGSDILTLEMLRKFYDTTVCEKAHNKTMPEWLTDKLFDQMSEIVFQGRDYLDGLGGFGQAEHDELTMLRGGPILKEMLDNMVEAIACQREWCHRPLKYRAYSAHDNTVIALLQVLGAKKTILGGQNPDYASMVVVELWNKGTTNGYDVQVLYSANHLDPFSSITKKVPGCSSIDVFCDYDTFKNRSRKYLPIDLDQQCEAQNKTQRLDFIVTNRGDNIRITSTIRETHFITKRRKSTGRRLKYKID